MKVNIPALYRVDYYFSLSGKEYVINYSQDPAGAAGFEEVIRKLPEGIAISKGIADCKIPTAEIALATLTIKLQGLDPK